MVRGERGERSFLIGALKAGLVKKTTLHRQKRKERSHKTECMKGWSLFRGC